MRRAWAIALFFLPGAIVLLPCARASATAQESEGRVVDRVLVRIEDDVILQSELRELAAYQQLVDGRAEANDQLVKELIEQWIVRNEASNVRFPEPAASEVDREVQRIADTFPNAQAYAARLKELDLAPETVRSIVSQQIYLARYLDYKFRPAVQVDDDAIAQYYKDDLSPALKAKGQTAPPLDTVSDSIRDVLIEKGVNERAAAWFDETKARLQIDVLPAAQTPASANP